MQLPIEQRAKKKPFHALFRSQSHHFRRLSFSIGACLSPFTISVPLVTAFASVKSKQRFSLNKKLLQLLSQSTKKTRKHTKEKIYDSPYKRI